MRISSPKLTRTAKRSASGRWPASTTDGDTSRAGPIVANDTDETIGYVIISSDMTQITDFMQRSSSLFFYVAIIVLVLALAAATFLSHQQAQPLAKVADAARALAVASWIPA